MGILVVGARKPFATFIDDEDIQLINSMASDGMTFHALYAGHYIYVAVKRKQKYVGLLHRIILCVADESVVVDHKNHDTLDNRRENLRQCRHADNMCNRITNRGRTLPLGVYWDAKCRRYVARAEKGKDALRKSFFDLNEAVAWREYAAAELFGQFAPERKAPLESGAFKDLRLLVTRR